MGSPSGEQARAICEGNCWNEKTPVGLRQKGARRLSRGTFAYFNTQITRLFAGSLLRMLVHSSKRAARLNQTAVSLQM
jgi:hypothetical protein